MTDISIAANSSSALLAVLAAGTAAGAWLRGSLSTPPETPGGSVFQTDKAARITTLSYIAVDQARCTGCGVCEAECAIAHGKGFDFWQSRIRSNSFEPGLDITSVCTSCADAPCIAACPKEAGALTRDRITNAILLNEAKCIGCRACIAACDKDRSGVIRLSRDGGKALGICDLCGSDPACVKVCPEQCLAIVPANQDGRRFAVKPEVIARTLSRNIFRSGRTS